MFSRKSKLVKVPFVLGTNMTMKLIRVYATEIALSDITGESFTVYTQEHVKHVKGLRINNPKIGFIFNGIFIAVCQLEYMLHGFDRLKSIIATKDLKEQSKKLLSQYEEKQGEL